MKNTKKTINQNLNLLNGFNLILNPFNNTFCNDDDIADPFDDNLTDGWEY